MKEKHHSNSVYFNTIFNQIWLMWKMGLPVAKYFWWRGIIQGEKRGRDVETHNSDHTVTGEHTMAVIKMIIKGSQCVFISPSQSRPAWNGPSYINIWKRTPTNNKGKRKSYKVVKLIGVLPIRLGFFSFPWDEGINWTVVTNAIKNWIRDQHPQWQERKEIQSREKSLQKEK